MHEQRWIDLMKKAAVDAVEATYPVKLMLGTVESTSPLLVRVDQKLTVPESALIRLRSTEPLKADWAQGGAAEVRRGLQPGDELLLLRMQGGQRFVVLDVRC